MIIRYDTARLETLIKDLYALTGISLSVLDTNFNAIISCSSKEDFCSHLQKTEKYKNLCQECDFHILNKCNNSKKLEGHICSAGLYDAAMPIIKYDTIVGYIIMGRVRSEKSPKTFDNADKDIKNCDILKNLYSQVPSMTKKQLYALYSLLPSVMFDNAIRIVYDPLANEIIEHINSNLQTDLSINYLCNRFYISANHLYNIFKENLGKTVNEYITEQRLALAKNLLQDSDYTVYEIAEKAGIPNYTYFCRLFKKKIGCTPTQYRNTNKKFRNNS